MCRSEETAVLSERVFATFTGYDLPVTPKDRISTSEAESSSTYNGPVWKYLLHSCAARTPMGNYGGSRLTEPADLVTRLH